MNRQGYSNLLFISISLACALTACDDPRSATEQLEPWVDKTAPLAWQGTRAQDQALLFTTNLEFVVVKKLDQPRTVCSTSSGSGGTETIETEVMGETRIQVPGETQTICEVQDTMDVTRVSRVSVVLKPKRGSKIEPSLVQEVVLGYHAKENLKRAMATHDFELASAGPEENLGPRPALLEKVSSGDDTLLVLKAPGLKLTQLRIRMGDGTHFQPGDDIAIEAIVESGSSSISALGSPVMLPQFKSAERTKIKQ